MKRETTAGEFTAELLETEAAKMPPSKQADAEVLRHAAQIYRELGSKKKVTVLEDDEQ